MIKMSGLRKNLADLVRFEFGIDQIKKLRDSFNPIAIPNLLTRGYMTIGEAIHFFEKVPEKFANGDYVGAAVEGGLIISAYEFGKYLMNEIFNYIERGPPSESHITQG